MGGDDRCDIFPIAQETLPWYTINFGTESATLAYFTDIYRTGTPKRIGESQRQWAHYHRRLPVYIC